MDDQFATKPMTTVKPAEQRVSEEELLSSFEQAISDRVQAISAYSWRVSGPLTHQPRTTGDRGGLVSTRGTSALPNVLVPLVDTRGAGCCASLLGKTWQRGIILASLALLLLMSGFDLMGLLVLYIR